MIERMIKMGFYHLSKEERQDLVLESEDGLMQSVQMLDIDGNNKSHVNIPEIILNYASDSDTYIRKNTYVAIGKIYRGNKGLREKILLLLDVMIETPEEKIRQTAVYALGEIGKTDANPVMKTFERALKDKHHSVRNAVIGSMKQMGQKNPEPTFNFAKKHLHDPDPKIRREIVHGIELRGRKHPEDVLPLLEELQDEKVKEVRDMIIHVIGQISYKKGCLEKVVKGFKGWKNMEIVCEAADEIVEVHKRYKFAARSPKEAETYLKQNLIRV